MPNLFSEIESMMGWQRIARRAVKKAFRPSLFARVDDRLKHWESWCEGVSWEIWEKRAGCPDKPSNEWSWDDHPRHMLAYDAVMAYVGGSAQRARALLHLAAQRGKDSNDANSFDLPAWLWLFLDDDSAENGDSSVDRAYEWLRQRALDGYYGFADTQWMRRFHCVKAAICVLVNRRGPEPGAYGDSIHERVRCNDDTVDSLGVWDDGVGYYEREPYGTTLEVGAGVFRNWWFDIGSL